MSKKFAKVLFNLVCILVVASMFTACAPAPTAAPVVPTEAPQAPVATAASAATATTAPAAPAATATTAPAAPAKEITLNVQHWDPLQVETIPYWNKILRDFEALHPGVKIVNNFIPFAQYLTTLETQLAGDQLPDVFFGHVKAAEIGRAGKSVDMKTVLDKAMLDGFYPGPLKQFDYSNTSGGSNQYALPYSAQLFGIFVDPAIMDKIGVKPPVTWDDLIAITPKIKAAGYTPLAWGNGGRNACPDFFLPLVTQNGGNVLNMDDSGKGWDGPESVKAFELLDKLARAGVFLDGINGVSWEQAEVIAIQGKAAMLWDGSWIADSVINKTAPPEYVKTYYVVKEPSLTADSPHWTGDGSGEGWVVKKGPNQDIAVEFIKYLFSDPVYATYIKETQYMPSRPAALDQVVDEKVKLMTSWLPDGSDHILFGQGTWDAVANACTAVIDGSLKPADAAKQVQKDIDTTRGR